MFNIHILLTKNTGTVHVPVVKDSLKLLYEDTYSIGYLSYAI